MSTHEADKGDITDLIPASVRTWIYGIVTAAIPLLSAYGIISEHTAPLWVALAAAILASGTALAYRPTRAINESDGGEICPPGSPICKA